MKKLIIQLPLPNERETWLDNEDLRWAAKHWAVRIGVKIPVVAVRSMQTKWASMSTAGRMTLNTDILTLPKTLGEFIIVHELIHILAPNHGKVFKSFMHAYLPDWQLREERLRQLERQRLTAIKRSPTQKKTLKRVNDVF